MHASSGATSGANLHSTSKDNYGLVQRFLLLSAELTRRVRAALSKVRPRLGALRGVLGGGEHGGVLGGGEHDGAGGLRCGARGFSRGGNALGGARGVNESPDEDDGLVYGGGARLGLGLGGTISLVMHASCSDIGSSINVCGATVL